MPSGWSIGSTVSTGSNWIAGNNNVTITTDQTTGNNMTVKIRPANNCATGLDNGQTPVVIGISRPAPTFTISGSSQFCTSDTYQITSLPGGATVNWYITPAPYFSYSQSGNILTVNRIADGDINITATVTTCQTFNATPKPVRVGGNPITVSATQTACNEYSFNVSGAITGATYNWSSANGNILFNGLSTTATTSTPSISATTTGSDIVVVNTNNTCSQSVYASTNASSSYPRQINGLYEVYSNGDQIVVSVNTTVYDTYYKWYINGVVDYEGESDSSYCTFFEGVGRNIVCGDNTMRVEVTACGITNSSDELHFYKQGNCLFSSIVSNVTAFPNPARDQVTIQLKEINKDKAENALRDIKEVKVLDKLGNLRKVLKYPSNSKSVSVNISNLPYDIYYLEVSDGTNKARLPLSILR